VARDVTNAAVIFIPDSPHGFWWWGSVLWRRQSYVIGPFAFFDLFTHTPGSGLLGVN